MKSFFSSTALVLKRHPFGESDLMVTLLAKGQGKMTLLAKGERKLSSRLCGKLEPFQTLRVEGRLGRGLGIVQEAETMIHFPLWKLDLPAQNALGFLAELSHRLIADGQECDQAMELWEEAMGCWPSHEAKTDILLHAFCIRLLSGLGFMANWKECGVSGQRLDLEKPIYLDPEEVSLSQSPTPSFRPLSPALVKWVSFMQSQPLAEIVKITPSQEQKEQVWALLQSLIRPLLSSPMKSERFLVGLSANTK